MPLRSEYRVRLGTGLEVVVEDVHGGRALVAGTLDAVAEIVTGGVAVQLPDRARVTALPPAERAANRSARPGRSAVRAPSRGG